MCSLDARRHMVAGGGTQRHRAGMAQHPSLIATVCARVDAGRGELADVHEAAAQQVPSSVRTKALLGNVVVLELDVAFSADATLEVAHEAVEALKGRLASALGRRVEWTGTRLSPADRTTYRQPQSR